MIVGLKGRVEYKEPSCIHMDVNGVVYEVFVSLHTYSSIAGDEVRLFTSHIIREDAQVLFGFLDMAEKKLFERLIKINGVGPKVAMAICSTYTPNRFLEIINNKDINGVKKVPGIGPKSAGRILVELNGFDAEILSSNDGTKSQAVDEATQALEALGFKKEKIAKALSGCKAEDTSTLVKEALRFLQTI